MKITKILLQVYVVNLHLQIQTIINTKKEKYLTKNYFKNSFCECKIGHHVSN